MSAWWRTRWLSSSSAPAITCRSTCGRRPRYPTAGKKSAMPSNDEWWLDAEAGPVVRPYALTRGRTRHSGEAFDLVATVTATQVRVADLGGLGPEHFSVLQL